MQNPGASWTLLSAGGRALPQDGVESGRGCQRNLKALLQEESSGKCSI